MEGDLLGAQAGREGHMQGRAGSYQGTGGHRSAGPEGLDRGQQEREKKDKDGRNGEGREKAGDDTCHTHWHRRAPRRHRRGQLFSGLEYGITEA